MPEPTTPKKYAFRKVIRLIDGQLAIRFFDAETGLPVTNLDGYIITSAGGFGDGSVPGATPPATDEDTQPAPDNIDSTTDGGSPFWDQWYDNPDVSRGSGDIIADLRKTVDEIYEKTLVPIPGISDETKTSVGSNVTKGINILDMLGGATDTPAPASPTAAQAPAVAQSASTNSQSIPGLGLATQAIPNEAGAPAPSLPSNITYAPNFDGKIRDMPVSETFIEKIGAALFATDPSLGIMITSGGQTADRGPFTKDGVDYTGSHRHDVNKDGKADTADFMITKDGKPMPVNINSAAIYTELAKNAAAVGFTGIGTYTNGHIHVGMGPVAVWGNDGTAKSANPAIVQAVNEGRQMAAKGQGELMVQTYLATNPRPSEAAPTAPVGQSALGAAASTTPKTSALGSAIAAPAGVDPRVIEAIGNITAKLGGTANATASGRVDMNPGVVRTTTGLAGTAQMPSDYRPTLNPNYVQPTDPTAVQPAQTVLQNTQPTTPSQPVNPSQIPGLGLATSQPTNPQPTAPQTGFMTPQAAASGIGLAGSGMKPATLSLPEVYPLDKDGRLETLVRTVMGEARGESVIGQAAVANVIINRALSGQFPPDPKDVAMQDKSGGKGYAQFSTWNPTTKHGNNPNQFGPHSPGWALAAKIVTDVYNGKLPDYTGGSLYYHANNIKPKWADGVMQNGTFQIGNHTFYPSKDSELGGMLRVPTVVDNSQTEPARGFMPPERYTGELQGNVQTMVDNGSVSDYSSYNNQNSGGFISDSEDFNASSYYSGSGNNEYTGELQGNVNTVIDNDSDSGGGSSYSGSGNDSGGGYDWGGSSYSGELQGNVDTYVDNSGSSGGGFMDSTPSSSPSTQSSGNYQYSDYMGDGNYGY